jgi:hypothetical protein
MLRSILAIIVGVSAGFVTVIAGDYLIHFMEPPPADMKPGDSAAFAAYIDSIPFFVLLVMQVVWLGSSFLGGFAASAVDKPNWRRSTMITGLLLFAAAAVNMVMIDHPVWMWVVSLMLYPPFAWVGGGLAQKLSTNGEFFQ